MRGRQLPSEQLSVHGALELAQFFAEIGRGKTMQRSFEYVLSQHAPPGAHFGATAQIFSRFGAGHDSHGSLQTPLCEMEIEGNVMLIDQGPLESHDAPQALSFSHGWPRLLNQAQMRPPNQGWSHSLHSYGL
jgi:hypothetical protein